MDTTCSVSKVEFTPQMYEIIAQKMKEIIENSDFYAGNIEVEDVDDCGTIFQIQMTAIVYHNKVVTYYWSGPEGGEITDIIPIWYESHTLVRISDDDYVETESDFSFNELRKWIK